MFDRSAIPKLAIFSVLSFLMIVCSTVLYTPRAAHAEGPVYNITGIDSDSKNNVLSIDIKGDTVPAFTVSEKFGPFRVVVDIAGAQFAETIDTSAPFIAENPIASMKMSMLKDQEPYITRFEIQVVDTHDYTVNRKGNGISVVISPASGKGMEKVTATSGAPAITDFKIDTSANMTVVELMATGPLVDYKVATIGSSNGQPARMFIDVANVSIDELIREKKVGTSLSRIRVAPRGTGARIVFDSATSMLFAYEVQPSDNGLKVVIDEKISEKVAGDKMASSDTMTDDTLSKLIESSSTLLEESKSGKADSGQPKDSVEAFKDNYAFSGYNNKRITVDFYKIDIHNVFRLFRQITDLNIIVDEAVSGTVTLALDDVPWDFALDIILNLQDLEKEERYNTIVIYPKKKEFVWPVRADDNLSIEADIEVVQQEALIIEQTAAQSEETYQAKQLIKQARSAENSGKLELAASLYEQALKLWSGNPKVYNRLASLYLVELGMNTKAVFIAKKALQEDPSNHSAALYAAIGSANMDRLDEAAEFFSMAISGEPPMKEALFSFAAFNENNAQYDAALKLLDKYHQTFGETLDTMLAKARILDKQGQTEMADKQYKAILTSGYQLTIDLKKYIQGRLAAGSY